MKLEDHGQQRVGDPRSKVRYGGRSNYQSTDVPSTRHPLADRRYASTCSFDADDWDGGKDETGASILSIEQKLYFHHNRRNRIVEPIHTRFAAELRRSSSWQVQDAYAGS